MNKTLGSSEAAVGTSAGRAFDYFVAFYEAKFDKAVDCLVKDRERPLASYYYPAEY